MKRANPAAVGAFVLGALALGLAGAIALGSGILLHHTQRFGLFFDGSVNGLTVGSPVKLRGIEVGRVVEMNALSDATQKQILNEVVIEVDPARWKHAGPATNLAERAQSLVGNGMRGRLELQSLVTGQLYVDFDFYPNTPVHLLGLDSTYPELPTVPSITEEAVDTVRALIARLQQLPLEDIARNLDATLAGLAKITQSPDLAAAIAELDETVADVRHTVRDAGKLAVDAETVVQPGSDERYQLALALQEVADAARSIRVLADTVQRNPSSLVFGRTRKVSR